MEAQCANAKRASVSVNDNGGGQVLMKPSGGGSKLDTRCLLWLPVGGEVCQVGTVVCCRPGPGAYYVEQRI